LPHRRAATLSISAQRTPRSAKRHAPRCQCSASARRRKLKPVAAERGLLGNRHDACPHWAFVRRHWPCPNPHAWIALTDRANVRLELFWADIEHFTHEGRWPSCMGQDGYAAQTCKARRSTIAVAGSRRVTAPTDVPAYIAMSATSPAVSRVGCESS